jgi:hypothetical protein
MFGQAGFLYLIVTRHKLTVCEHSCCFMYWSVSLCTLQLAVDYQYVLEGGSWEKQRGGIGEAKGRSWRGRIKGVGWGQSRAIKLLYASAPPPPTVWVLKPPSFALHLLYQSLANIYICICICTSRYDCMHM